MKTVLIADDEPKVRLLISTMMASAGGRYAVIEAADGNQAWSLIQKHRPPLVLLDVVMPGRSGLELTQAIRSNPDLESTRIILLTARAREADIQDGLRAGVDVYLTKPFSPRQLLSTIERALGDA